jgi:hypothetical protein
MSDELFRRRRLNEQKITERLKANGMPSDDRSVSRARLGIVSTTLGCKPTWENYTCTVQDNEFSEAARRELSIEIKRTKAELQASIANSGELLVGKGKFGVFMDCEKEVVAPVENAELSSAERVKLNYEKRRQQQQQQVQENTILNRQMAKHLYQTTEQTELNVETCKDMQNCSEAGVENQANYLAAGHNRMYQSAEYQSILRRRKDIKLCKSSQGTISESAQRTVSDLLEFDKKPRAPDDDVID